MKTELNFEQLLGAEASYLLDYQSTKIARGQLHLPGPEFVDRVWQLSDRNSQTLRAFNTLLNHGRLAGTGYLSILPVDQGIEHSAGASFAANPAMFDPENIVRLAIEGGCNAVTSSLGVLASVSRKYAHKIPMVLKLNHNELLSYPNQYDQTFFARVRDAWNMGCIGVGATIYFGSPESSRQLREVSDAFAQAHELGMLTMLWCYLRNPGFTINRNNYETAADLEGQANHLGASIAADLIKQKLPTINGGYRAVRTVTPGYGKFDERMYTDLATDHPIDWTRYQVANNYMGRCGLITSGGPSETSDLSSVVRTAVINKRAGGMGLITGRKAFQRPIAEGVVLLHAVQDVYLDERVTVA